ncbi:MAG: hypothetical protein WBM50_04655, partial [Acidimicrobiales bacterium]
AQARVTVVPIADLRLTAAVEEGPQGGGITTGSEMRYRITIENRGPDPIPADSISLVIFVDRSDSAETATIEVSRFSSGGLKNLPGNACGVGRHQILRCTNRQAMEPGSDISLVIAHRHPAAVAGVLSFFAEVSSRNGEFVDPDGSGNGFEGPGYSFRNPPTTSTSSTMATTTTMDQTTTSGDPSGSSMTGSSSAESSTTSEATSSTPATTTTSSTTTATSTSAPTTTTPQTTTTTVPTTASFELMTGSDVTLVAPGSSVGSVLDATGTGTDVDPAVALAALPEDGDGGPPYLLIGGLLAGIVLLSGIGLAGYAHVRHRDPPLVDIRQYH